MGATELHDPYTLSQVVPQGILSFLQLVADPLSEIRQFFPAPIALQEEDEAVAGKAEEPPIWPHQFSKPFRHGVHHPIPRGKTVNGVDLAQIAQVYQHNRTISSIHPLQPLRQNLTQVFVVG